jgi:hypothetical protein
MPNLKTLRRFLPGFSPSRRAEMRASTEHFRCAPRTKKIEWSSLLSLLSIQIRTGLVESVRKYMSESGWNSGSARRVPLKR